MRTRFVVTMHHVYVTKCEVYAQDKLSAGHKVQRLMNDSGMVTRRRAMKAQMVGEFLDVQSVVKKERLR